MARNRNKNLQKNHVERSGILFNDFVKLLQNQVNAFQICVLAGGDIIKERRDTNYQWKLKPVSSAMVQFSLTPVRFNGCAVGLQTAKGEPTKKP